MTGLLRGDGGSEAVPTCAFKNTREVEGLMMSLHNCKPFVTNEASMLIGTTLNLFMCCIRFLRPPSEKRCTSVAPKATLAADSYWLSNDPCNRRASSTSPHNESARSHPGFSGNYSKGARNLTSTWKTDGKRSHSTITHICR